jgi:hypothetical protein
MRRDTMKFKLKDVQNNPFRDLTLNPLDPYKVAELVSSIHDTGFWDNCVVRINTAGKPELAYGHNRLQAAKQAGLTETDFIVKELDDALMLKIMTRENSPEYEYNILALLESVKGAVLGFASGRITPSVPEGTPKKYIRYAPSFIPGEEAPASKDRVAYTAESIAEYLGETKSAGEGRARAKDRVIAALNALEILQRQTATHEETFNTSKKGLFEGQAVTQYKPNYSFLYTGTPEGGQRTLSASALLKVTQEILARQKASLVDAVKSAATAQKYTKRMSELDAERHAEEQKEKERLAELRRREVEAHKEEDDKEAKAWAEEKRIADKKKEERLLEFRLKRDGLDAKVGLALERAQFAQRSKDLPIRDAALTEIHNLETRVSERNPYRDYLKSLSRSKTMKPAEREGIRRGLLAVSDWYAEQAIAFRPAVYVDVLAEARRKEEAKRKRDAEVLVE